MTNAMDLRNAKFMGKETFRIWKICIEYRKQIIIL
jgi:hypothetical protein